MTPRPPPPSPPSLELPMARWNTRDVSMVRGFVYPLLDDGSPGFSHLPSNGKRSVLDIPYYSVSDGRRCVYKVGVWSEQAMLGPVPVDGGEDLPAGCLVTDMVLVTRTRPDMFTGPVFGTCMDDVPVDPSVFYQHLVYYSYLYLLSAYGMETCLRGYRRVLRRMYLFSMTPPGPFFRQAGGEISPPGRARLPTEYVSYMARAATELMTVYSRYEFGPRSEGYAEDEDEE